MYAFLSLYYIYFMLFLFLFHLFSLTPFQTFTNNVILFTDDIHIHTILNAHNNKKNIHLFYKILIKVNESSKKNYSFKIHFKHKKKLIIITKI